MELFDAVKKINGLWLHMYGYEVRIMFHDITSNRKHLGFSGQYGQGKAVFTDWEHTVVYNIHINYGIKGWMNSDIRELVGKKILHILIHYFSVSRYDSIIIETKRFLYVRKEDNILHTSS